MNINKTSCLFKIFCAAFEYYSGSSETIMLFYDDYQFASPSYGLPSHRLPVVFRKMPKGMQKGLQKVIKKRKQILEHPVSPKHYWTMFEHVCQITFKLDIKDKRKKAYSSANDGGQRHPINLKRVFTNFHQWPWRFVSMKGSQITRCYCMWELQGVQEIFSK